MSWVFLVGECVHRLFIAGIIPGIHALSSFDCQDYLQFWLHVLFFKNIHFCFYLVTKPLICWWSWTGKCSQKICGDCLLTITLSQGIVLLTAFVWWTVFSMSYGNLLQFSFVSIAVIRLIRWAFSLQIWSFRCPSVSWCFAWGRQQKCQVLGVWNARFKCLAQCHTPSQWVGKFAERFLLKIGSHWP